MILMKENGMFVIDNFGIPTLIEGNLNEEKDLDKKILEEVNFLVFKEIYMLLYKF